MNLLGSVTRPWPNLWPILRSQPFSDCYQVLFIKTKWLRGVVFPSFFVEFVWLFDYLTKVSWSFPGLWSDSCSREGLRGPDSKKRRGWFGKRLARFDSVNKSTVCSCEKKHLLTFCTFAPLIWRPRERTRQLPPPMQQTLSQRWNTGRFELFFNLLSPFFVPAYHQHHPLDRWRATRHKQTNKQASKQTNKQTNKQTHTHGTFMWLAVLCKEKEFLEMDVIEEMKKLGAAPSYCCWTSMPWL